MSKIIGCPRECDPMEHIDEFLSGDLRTLSGFKMDGLQSLKDTVVSELSEREPESRTVNVDRDWLSDMGVDFARDLKKAVERTVAEGGRTNFIVFQDVPVVGWQSAFEGLDPKKAQVYLFTNACLQVPCCYKLIE